MTDQQMTKVSSLSILEHHFKETISIRDIKDAILFCILIGSNIYITESVLLTVALTICATSLNDCRLQTVVKMQRVVTKKNPCNRKSNHMMFPFNLNNITSTSVNIVFFYFTSSQSFCYLIFNQHFLEKKLHKSLGNTRNIQ